jgi:hypothetical protein
MNGRHFTTGIACWLGAATAIGLATHIQLRSSDHSIVSVARGVSQWTTGRRTEIPAVCPQKILLALGDPVLMQDSAGAWQQVGVVSSTGKPAGEGILTDRVTLTIYNNALHTSGDAGQLQYHWTPGSLDWVFQTLLPPERQQEIAALIEADWKQHQTEVLQSLSPVIQESINRSIQAIEDELPLVIERHRLELTKLGDRYKTEMVRKQILPLVEENILPIVEQEARPLATEIGRRLWERVSLWSFTWRYIYDVSPLPERNAVQKEFQRFMDDEVLPELRSHSDEFVAAIERVVSRVSRDPAVSETLRLSLRQVVQDPEFHAIVWSMLREAVVENQTLRTSLNEYWHSAAPQEAIRLANTRFEPTVRKIGDRIFGSREGGISAEFSRVLRAQILLKDRQWLVLTPSPGEPSPASSESPPKSAGSPQQLTITPATEPMMFPIQFEGSEQSPLSVLQ